MSAALDSSGPGAPARDWIGALRAWSARPGARVALRAIYYLAILVGLLLIYGRGDFSTPPFIYQGF